MSYFRADCFPVQTFTNYRIPVPAQFISTKKKERKTTIYFNYELFFKKRRESNNFLKYRSPTLTTARRLIQSIPITRKYPAIYYAIFRYIHMYIHTYSHETCPQSPDRKNETRTTSIHPRTKNSKVRAYMSPARALYWRLLGARREIAIGRPISIAAIKPHEIPRMPRCCTRACMCMLIINPIAVSLSSRSITSSFVLIVGRCRRWRRGESVCIAAKQFSRVTRVHLASRLIEGACALSVGVIGFLLHGRRSCCELGDG